MGGHDIVYSRSAGFDADIAAVQGFIADKIAISEDFRGPKMGFNGAKIIGV